MYKPTAFLVWPTLNYTYMVGPHYDGSYLRVGNTCALMRPVTC